MAIMTMPLSRRRHVVRTRMLNPAVPLCHQVFKDLGMRLKSNDKEILTGVTGCWEPGSLVVRRAPAAGMLSMTWHPCVRCTRARRRAQ